MKGNWFYFAPATATFSGDPYLVGPFNTKANALKHAKRAHKAVGGDIEFENPSEFVFIQALTGPYIKATLTEAGLKW